MGKEYLLITRLKNNLILKKMKEKGYDTVRSLAKEPGVDLSESAITHFINFRRSYLDNKTGDFSSTFKKLAEFLGCIPEELVTPDQLKIVRDNVIKKTELSFEQLANLSALVKNDQPMNLLEEIEKEERTQRLPFLLEDVLKKACNNHKRNIDIMKRRYGLDDYHPHTYSEIGQKYGISMQRVIDIESKILKRIRINECHCPLLKEDIQIS